MKVFLAFVAVLSGISLLPLFLFSFWNTSQLFNYLRDNHPATWQELGEPQVRIDAQENMDSPSIRYFTTKRFLEIHDPELHTLGFNARRAVHWAASSFFVFMFSFLALVTGGQMGWL